MELNVTSSAADGVAQPSFTYLISPTLYNLLIKVIIGFGLPVQLLSGTSNIITIITYFKLGFSDSTNISLTALAISDFGVAFSAACMSVFLLLPWLKEILIPLEFVFTTLGYPHIMLTRSSALITAYLSVERYLCVYLPLRIRSIFTPRRTLVAMISIFLVVFPPMTIVYFCYPLGPKYIPAYNTTLIGILPVTDSVIWLSFLVFQAYSSAVLPFSTFIVVTFCTVLLALSLTKSKAWRDLNRGPTATQANTESSEMKSSTDTAAQPKRKTVSKETRVVKMVVAVATVFIASSIPSCAHILVVMVVPEYDIDGRYADVFVLCAGVFLFIDSVNAGANFIIYYNMSTKFRLSVRELFNMKTDG